MILETFRFEDFKFCFKFHFTFAQFFVFLSILLSLLVIVFWTGPI